MMKPCVVCNCPQGEKLEEYVPPPPEVEEAAEAGAAERSSFRPKGRNPLREEHCPRRLGSNCFRPGCKMPMRNVCLSVWVGSGAVQGVAPPFTLR